ncbi:replication endonuclease [Burkholderia gladioli]|uniref:replication endonuclease n=1 Tax=Burkholderia gladioli TaxID=28095 RepID=UPI0016407D00|nr:replication endonuclease [Burkholderia gladioli]MBU9155096.1 replication endonuclease [Burkholderia gladioli]MDC6126488.1 replication endonuclease [Burkholderia gladioli]
MSETLAPKQVAIGSTNEQRPVTKNWHSISIVGVPRTAVLNRLDDENFTLSALAARDLANAQISRRAALMDRVAEYEAAAAEKVHVGTLFTMTCPHRMQPSTRVMGRSVLNLDWDGTTAEEANAYLVSIWSRIRVELARADIYVYGFRISEPTRNGVPALHCMFYHVPEGAKFVHRAVWRHAGEVSGEFRSFAPWEMGAYVRKYIFAAMDREGADLFGEV